MRRAWVMIGATIATFVVPLLVLLVLRNPSESVDCRDGRCSFSGAPEAQRVLEGAQGDDGLEEHGWKAMIIEDIGDPTDIVTCDHDAVTVTVLSWRSAGDEMIIDTMIVGWSDGEMLCSERRAARISDIPAAAMSGDVGLGGVLTVALPDSGDTFLVTPDG